MITVIKCNPEVSIHPTFFHQMADVCVSHLVDKVPIFRTASTPSVGSHPSMLAPCYWHSFFLFVILFLYFRLKEIKMNKVIWEILFYIIFLYLLMLVAYGNRDPLSYQLLNNFKSQVVSASHDPSHIIGTHAFSKVSY